MVMVPAYILGGLPVIAEVWFSGPDHNGEYDAGVDQLYWRKSSGECGKELSEKMYVKLYKHQPYWEADITEIANDWLSTNVPIKNFDGTIDGEYTSEYLLLNPVRVAS